MFVVNQKFSKRPLHHKVESEIHPTMNPLSDFLNGLWCHLRNENLVNGWIITRLTRTTKIWAGSGSPRSFRSALRGLDVCVCVCVSAQLTHTYRMFFCFHKASLCFASVDVFFNCAVYLCLVQELLFISCPSDLCSPLTATTMSLIGWNMRGCMQNSQRLCCPCMLCACATLTKSDRPNFAEGKMFPRLGFT